MRLNFLAVGTTTLVTTLVIAACSGGGGSGGSSSTSGKATGPLSVPNATCGGNSCMTTSSAVISPMSTSSDTAVLEIAGEIYSHFTGTIIPGINGVLYQLEQAAAENDLKTCQKIADANASTGVPLGSGYTVDIEDDVTGTLKNIPTGMDDAGTEMKRKFVFALNSTKFAEAQIYCNSGTQRTFYIRLMDASANMYEFWSQVDGNKRTIFGAMDKGNQRYTLYFHTAAGTAFQLHTVANDIEYNGATNVHFAVAGGADISANKADVAYAIAGQVPTALTATDTANSSWSYTDIRHCYGTISPAIVTTGATCTGLSLLTAAPALPVRTSATAWSVNGMNGNVIPTTF